MADEKEKRKLGRHKKYLTEEERKAAKVMQDKARHSDYYQRHREELIAKAKAWRMKNGQKKPPADKEKALAKLTARMKRKQMFSEKERRARSPMDDEKKAKVLAGIPESVRLHTAALARIKEGKEQREQERKYNKAKEKSNGDKREDRKQA